MDIRELKKIINDKDKVVVINDGEPAFVILSFEEYKKIKGEENQITPGFDNIPKELIEEPLKIEDLPF